MDILLKEFRCTKCGKLLCKGLLKDIGSLVEVKCRGCGDLATFQGRNGADIISEPILKTYK